MSSVVPCPSESHVNSWPNASRSFRSVSTEVMQMRERRVAAQCAMMRMQWKRSSAIMTSLGESG